MTTPTFYIEKQALNYPKTQNLLDKYKEKRIILIDNYAEIFNRKNQDFRKQKGANTFILAVKKGELIQKNPEYCVSHIKDSYYFSTSLNCIFDCEYCFLQGMYASSYIVLFVNIDDFKNQIDSLVASSKKDIMFFGAYDNDSLAIDNISDFSNDFIPWFGGKKHAFLELRTKSSNISSLKKLKPVDNVTVAFTLSPEEIQKKYEKKSSSLSQRIKAIDSLQNLGWKVAIRVEPVIYSKDYKEIYGKFFKYIKTEINFSSIENIYFGSFKIPEIFFKKIRKMYPYSKLFNGNLCLGTADQLTYKDAILNEMEGFIYEKLCDITLRGKIYTAKF